MRRFAVFGAALFVVLAASLSAAAYGGPQTAASACGGGKLVVNVTQKVINDADSGVAGNVWAFDNYNRHIQVWQTAPGTFCATVDYVGKFVTNAGPSPENTGTVSAGISGNFNGGYRATITGVLNPSPAYATKGNIGTFDYACDTSFNCPGYVSWVSTYFSSSAFTYDWWGWQYRTPKNGTWINSSDGNSGDITG